MRTLIVATAAFFAFTFAAHAGQCPSLMEEVDAQMESADLSEDERAEVMALRTQGEAQHEAGDHDASVESLQQALEILGE